MSNKNLIVHNQNIIFFIIKEFNWNAGLKNKGKNINIKINNNNKITPPNFFGTERKIA